MKEVEARTRTGALVVVISVHRALSKALTVFLVEEVLDHEGGERVRHVAKVGHRHAARVSRAEVHAIGVVLRRAKQDFGQPQL